MLQQLQKLSGKLLKRLTVWTILLLALLSLFQPTSAYASSQKFGERDVKEINEIVKQVNSKDKKIRDRGIGRINYIINKTGKDKVKKLYQNFIKIKDTTTFIREVMKLKRDEAKSLLLSMVPVSFSTENPKKLQSPQKRESETFFKAQDQSQNCKSGEAYFMAKSLIGFELFKYEMGVRFCWRDREVYDYRILYKKETVYSALWRFVEHNYELCRYLGDDKFVYACDAEGEFEGTVLTPWGQLVFQRGYAFVWSLGNANGFYGGSRN